MATYERIGLQSFKDSEGNRCLLYPVTKAECVDGLDEAIDEALAKEDNIYIGKPEDRPKGCTVVIDPDGEADSEPNEVSWNDIKDKPFGETRTVILEEQDVLFEYDEGMNGHVAYIPCGVELHEADYLRVVYDGEESITQIKMNPDLGDMMLFGNIGAMGIPGHPDTGEAFTAMYMSGTICIMSIDGSDNHTISISKLSIAPIPNAYLHKTIFYTSGISSDPYIYTDALMTKKANRGDIPSIENIILSYAGGIVQLNPVAVVYGYDGGSAYDSILTYMNYGFSSFYTAEYDPATATSEE